MATIGIYARRRQEKCFFVRGIGGMADKPASEVIEADNKTEARKKFEKKHPRASIVQVNERDC